MIGEFKLYGLMGTLIYLATVILLAVMALFNLTFYLNNPGQNGAKWAKYFLVSSLILLAFDGVCYIFYSQNRFYWNSQQNGNFDDRMFSIWIPLHLICYFLLPF